MGDTGTPSRRFMSRREAAEYITRTYFKVSAKTMAVWASFEEGPPYRLMAGRAHYTKKDIDDWIDRPGNGGKVRPPRINEGTLGGGERK